MGSPPLCELSLTSDWAWLLAMASGVRQRTIAPIFFLGTYLHDRSVASKHCPATTPMAIQ